MALVVTSVKLFGAYGPYSFTTSYWGLRPLSVTTQGPSGPLCRVLATSVKPTISFKFFAKNLKQML